MKKTVVILLCAVTALASCGTYAGQGAATGATLGSILGSAIGGIYGGPRGSDLGTIIGMAGGATVGASVGAQADKAKQEEYRRYMEYRENSYGRSRRTVPPRSDRSSSYAQPTAPENESGFDPTHSGDDRIVFEPDSDNGHYGYDNGGNGHNIAAPSVSVDQLRAALPGYKIVRNKNIEVRNIEFTDANGNGILSRRESARLSFEIMNNSDVTLYDVNPMVQETTGNKHVHISSPLRIERIEPWHGVRYTATVYADSRIKDGEIGIRVAVIQGDKEITSQVREFKVTTAKR